LSIPIKKNKSFGWRLACMKQQQGLNFRNNKPNHPFLQFSRLQTWLNGSLYKYTIIGSVLFQYFADYLIFKHESV
jgi:hypothetical protein